MGRDITKKPNVQTFKPFNRFTPFKNFKREKFRADRTLGSSRSFVDSGFKVMI
jgi:hypothetical protein